MPLVLILAGPNRAGKSTAAPVVVNERFGLRVFVNADEIARGLSAYSTATVAVEAGRIMLARLDELVARGADFALESTLSGSTLAQRIKVWRNRGYRVHLVYLWVPSPEFCIARVSIRVALGGHSVPEADIRRRYTRSISNFLRLYRPLADVWEVYDASLESGPELVANNDWVIRPDTWLTISGEPSPWHQ